MKVTGSQIHVGEVTCGGSPQLSRKYDQIKIRGKVDMRVTSPTFFLYFIEWDVYNKTLFTGNLHTLTLLEELYTFTIFKKNGAEKE